MASRAKRCSEACSKVAGVAEDLQSIDTDINEELSEKEKETKKEEILKEAEVAVDNLDYSELETLKEELESWRDGLQGTNLENSNKYSMLEEAIDSLENAISTLSSVSSVEDVEEIENVVQEIEDAVSEAENVDFPTMYS